MSPRSVVPSMRHHAAAVPAPVGLAVRLGRQLTLSLLSAAVLLACGSAPPVPDWQLLSRGAVDRATQAELTGQSRVADLEWQRARVERSATASAEPLARLAVRRCAVRQARLLWSPDCQHPLAGLENGAHVQPLQAYARYLAARMSPADVPHLPPVHMPLAQAMLSEPVPPPDADARAQRMLAAIDDPLSRLVAASVLWQAGWLGRAGLALAVDTAAAQGWRAAVWAWLSQQQQWAERHQDPDLAREAAQRIEWATLPAAGGTADGTR